MSFFLANMIGSTGKVVYSWEVKGGGGLNFLGPFFKVTQDGITTIPLKCGYA